MCCCTQIDVMDIRLRRVGVDEKENTNAAGEAVLDGALARIKKGNEIKAVDAADAGGRECRRQILGDAEDCSAISAAVMAFVRRSSVMSSCAASQISSFRCARQ